MSCNMCTICKGQRAYTQGNLYRILMIKRLTLLSSGLELYGRLVTVCLQNVGIHLPNYTS